MWIMAYTRTHGVRRFFGVYDMEWDTLDGGFAPTKNGQTFLLFLKWLRRRYRRAGTLHIVMDNGGYHLTRDSRPSPRREAGQYFTRRELIGPA